MADIFLHTYKPGESISALNAAHKYRLARKSGNDVISILKLWEIYKKKVLDKLSDALKERFSETSVFAIAMAPSNTTHFINDISAHLRNTFPNTIDISNCFSKINEFEAGIINHALNAEELRNSIALNSECYRLKVNQDVKQVLLVDDVFSLGNTFNAMKLVISEYDNTKEIITAAILKTT